MYLQLPLLLYLLASVAPSDAGLFTRSSEHVLRGVNAAHHHAVKRSSGLAKDLRRALSGILVAEGDSGAQHVYCISGTSLTNPDTSPGGGGSSGSSPKASGTATASASSPSGTVASSPWKVKQSYVCAILTRLDWARNLNDHRKGIRFSTAGRSSPLRILRTELYNMSTRVLRYVFIFFD